MDRRQLPAEPRQLSVGLQFLSQLLLGNLIQMGQKIFDRSEGLDQFNGRLLPDPRDPGILSMASPARPMTSTTCSGLTPKRSMTSSTPNFSLLHGVVDLDPVTHQLEDVLVPGDDDDIRLRFHALGHRSNEVIRLVSFHLQRGNPITFDDPFDIRDLEDEALRHGRSVGLIFLVDFASKGRGPRIKGHDKIVRLMIFENLEEHLGEAIDGIGGKAFGIGEMADGIEGTIDIRGAIDQKEARTNHS